MNVGAILRSKTVAIVSAGFLGAGLLGGIAVAAVPAPNDVSATTVPDASTANATDEKKRAQLKAVLDALVAKNVITQAQEDAIIAALATAAKHEHPTLREFVGDVAKESLGYLGLPADQVKQQLRSGKSLGEIANSTPGKSRADLLKDLDAKSTDRITAAVAAGTLTRAQADGLLPKINTAIEKIVDHKRAPTAAQGKGTAAGRTAPKPPKS